MSILQQTLRHLLDEKNITPSQLAKESGVKQPVIHRILSGETLDPKIGTVSAIADYLNISINDLVGKSSLKSSITIPIYQLDTLQQSLEKALPSEETYTAPSGINEKDFAIRISDSTMSPRFDKDTLIIADPDVKCKDRDYVIIYLVEKKLSLFRQILFDGHDIYLKPLNGDFPTLQVTSAYEVLGVVIQAVINLDHEHS